MISDPTSFAISQNIIKPEYFDSTLRSPVKYILDYSNKYRTLPTPLQIKAETKMDIDLFEGVTPQHSEWYLDVIEKFAKKKAYELIILDGINLLDADNEDEIEKRMKDAFMISLTRDLGTNYFENPLERLQNMLDKTSVMTTGWKSVDDKLFGGFNKGTLNIFAANSGVGKSIVLQNIAINWALMGMNVIYITLELAENLVSLRLDAMITSTGTKDVMRDIEKSALKINMIGKKAGELRVKKFPQDDTNCNKLRAYLKEYEISTGKRPDAVVVDYLDLLSPNSTKVDKSNFFVKDKYVAEELRSLMEEYDCYGATASQFNRSGVSISSGNEGTISTGGFDHSHIAGGISKINTADNLIAIHATDAMKTAGVMRFQLLKTRTSSGVGHYIDLHYDPNTMRITDIVISETTSKPTETIRAELKEKTKTDNPKETSGANDSPKKPREGISDLMKKFKTQS